jgi:hypothetical protein
MKPRRALERLGGLAAIAVIVIAFMAYNSGYSLSNLPDAVRGNLSGVLGGWGGKDMKFADDYEILALDDDGKPVTFAHEPIEFAIDESASTDDEARIRAAFEKTASASGFEFRYIGRTEFDATLQNLGESPARIVVSYENKTSTDVFQGLPDDSVAVGYSVVQAGVRIKGAVVVSEEDAVRGVALERLIMHELGHVLGIGHAGSNTQIMGPNMHGSYPAEWGSGDLAALRLLRQG